MESQLVRLGAELDYVGINESRKNSSFLKLENKCSFTNKSTNAHIGKAFCQNTDF